MPGEGVVYISYNGITEPLVQSQVLPYLRGFVAEGVDVRLLTFEPKGASANGKRTIKEELESAGVRWSWVPRMAGAGPVSIAVNVARGAVAARRLIGRGDRLIVHSRSLIPAIVGHLVSSFHDTPFLFDIRGFWVDEKVLKGGLRSGSVGHRLGKRLEAYLYRKADAIVSLTHAGADELTRLNPWGEEPAPPIVVIPTCVDLSRFSSSARSQVKDPVVVSVGSLGKGYLAEEIFVVFSAIRKRYPGARLRIVTRSDSSGLKAMAREMDVPESAWTIESAEPRNIPAILSGGHVGLSFIEPHYSKIASCATKNAEYLAAGLLLVANGGIGDVDSVIPENGVGVVLEDFEPASVDRAVDELQRLLADPETPTRCERMAREEYAIEIGVARYMDLYRRLWSAARAGSSPRRAAGVR